MHAGTVFLRLAQRLEDVMSEPFPWPRFEDLARDGLSELYERNRPRLEGVTREQFLAGLLERGGWFAMPELPEWTPPPPASV